MVGVNHDASLFFGAPGSGVAARHAAVARSARVGSAFRPAAASLAGPAARSLRRNKPGRGHNSCTQRPGCGSRRIRKTVPMQPRRGLPRTEQVDERHVCRDIAPACVLPSTVWGTALRPNRQVQNRRRACPSIRANLAASPRPSHPRIFRQNNVRPPAFRRAASPQNDARSQIYAGSESHRQQHGHGGLVSGGSPWSRGTSGIAGGGTPSSCLARAMLCLQRPLARSP